MIRQIYYITTSLTNNDDHKTTSNWLYQKHSLQDDRRSQGHFTSYKLSHLCTATHYNSHRIKRRIERTRSLFYTEASIANSLSFTTINISHLTYSYHLSMQSTVLHQPRHYDVGSWTQRGKQISIRCFATILHLCWMSAVLNVIVVVQYY